MKIRKIVSSVIATVGIFACVAACGSGNGSSGTTDTKKDKGLPVMGHGLTTGPSSRWRLKAPADLRSLISIIRTIR